MCGRQTSPTAGTILEHTRASLAEWFLVVWWVCDPRWGVNARLLQTQLQLGSYQTAWNLLHRLRLAMGQGRGRLKGRVEVDEIDWQASGKTLLIAIAVEKVGAHGVGRVRMRSLPDASSESLGRFIQENVERRSLVNTDAWEGYESLRALGFRHRVARKRRQHGPGVEPLPHVQRVATEFEDWLAIRRRAAMSQTHLDSYLDEFTFRFEERRPNRHRKLFRRLLRQIVTMTPVLNRELARRRTPAESPP